MENETLCKKKLKTLKKESTQRKVINWTNAKKEKEGLDLPMYERKQDTPQGKMDIKRNSKRLTPWDTHKKRNALTQM